MKKLSYLITHGDREEGVNPIHTDKGREQILRLEIPADVTKLVIGTGNRFQEIANMIYSKGGDYPCLSSPFCGGVEGIRMDTEPGKPNMILTASGFEIPEDQYLGLRNTIGFDPWVFVEGQDAGTLFCAGGELLLALGFEGRPPKGALFAIDVETKTVTLFQQG